MGVFSFAQAFEFRSLFSRKLMTKSEFSVLITFFQKFSSSNRDITSLIKLSLKHDVSIFSYASKIAL